MWGREHSGSCLATPTGKYKIIGDLETLRVVVSDLKLNRDIELFGGLSSGILLEDYFAIDGPVNPGRILLDSVPPKERHTLRDPHQDLISGDISGNRESHRFPSLSGNLAPPISNP